MWTASTCIITEDPVITGIDDKELFSESAWF